MSTYQHYRRRVLCPEHPGCILWPSERCGAVTQAGRQCQHRAAPGSLYCPGSHGAHAWNPEIAHYRRGHPLEVEHRQREQVTVETLANAPLQLIGHWGALSDEQVSAVMAGPDGSLDRLLQEILARG